MHVQETTEGAVRVLSLGLLLRSGLGGLGATRSSSRGNGSGRGVGVGVGDAVLELLDLGPGEVSLDGDGEDVLVRVDDRVHDRGQGGEADGQRDARDGADAAGQRLEELLLANVEHAGVEALALVVDLRDAHAEGEGRDVEHVEQGRLGGADLGALLDELEVGGDFDGTTGDLGGHAEGLEEGGLAGLHAGVASGHPDIDGGQGTGTGGRGDAVGEDEVTGLLEVAVGEDEANVALDEGQETLVLGGVVDETLEGTANLEGV